MEDLNCPSCGTTQLKIEPGYCDCCGYEFTSEYINRFVAEQRKKEEAIRRKEAEEERRKRIQQQIEREKEKARQKERQKALEAAAKERAEREKTRRLIERDNTRYNRELKYAAFFNKFKTVVSKVALVITIASIVLSVFVGRENINQSPINEVEIKIQQISNALTIQQISYDDESGLFYERKDASETSEDILNDSAGLSNGLVKLLNSMALIVKNRTDFDDKIAFAFPLLKSLKDANTSVNTDSDPVSESNLISQQSEEEKS